MHTPARAWLPALTAGLVLAVAVAIALLTGGDRPAPTRQAAIASIDEGVGILHGWDRSRARAYADGDASALRRLYVEGSRTGRRDVAILKRYAQRGLRIRGLANQLLGVRTLHESQDRLVLEVTDRLVGGVAVGRGHRLALPGDQVSRRRVVLRLIDETWRVAEAYPIPNA